MGDLRAVPLLVLTGLLLSGCFGPSKGTAPSRHVEARCDPEAYSEEEVNRIARGRDADPALKEIREAYASGRMSDQQFALLQGRLHNAGMSAIRVQEMIRDMQAARAGSREQSGLGK